MVVCFNFRVLAMGFGWGVLGKCFDMLVGVWVCDVRVLVCSSLCRYFAGYHAMGFRGGLVVIVWRFGLYEPC